MSRTSSKPCVSKSDMQELSSLFGTVTENIDLIKSKYKNLITTISNIHSLLTSFQKSIPGLPVSNKDEITEDIETLMSIVEKDKQLYDNLTFEDQSVNQEIDLFQQFKKCQTIKIIITMAAYLADYEKYLDSLEKIKTIPGQIWSPYNRIRFNFKAILHHTKCAQFHFILLKTFFEKSINLHKLLNVPEIDIDKVEQGLLKYIEVEEKQNGGKEMIEVLHMLKGAVKKFRDRFGYYYEQAVQSGNQATIIELLVTDTAEDLMEQHKKTKRRNLLIKIMRLRKYMKTVIDRIKRQGGKLGTDVIDKISNITNKLSETTDKLTKKYKETENVNEEEVTMDDKFDVQELLKELGDDTPSLD